MQCTMYNVQCTMQCNERKATSPIAFYCASDLHELTLVAKKTSPHFPKGMHYVHLAKCTALTHSFGKAHCKVGQEELRCSGRPAQWSCTVGLQQCSGEAGRRSCTLCSEKGWQPPVMPGWGSLSDQSRGYK